MLPLKYLRRPLFINQRTMKEEKAFMDFRPFAEKSICNEPLSHEECQAVLRCPDIRILEPLNAACQVGYLEDDRGLRFRDSGTPLRRNLRR
jgi:hypothetical protein